MSKGGGGGGTTQTIQKADPWIGLQGPLSTLYSQAQANYNSPGPVYYPGSTVAGQSALTQQAQQLTQQRAAAGNPLVPQAQQQLYATLGDQYYGMNPATSGLSGLAGTSTNPSMTGLQNFASSASDPTAPWLQSFMGGSFTNPSFAGLQSIAGGGNDPSMAQLSSIGSGAMLGANPYLDAAFGQAAGRVGEQFSKYTMPGVASMFSSAGRYGSNAMQEATNQAEQNFGDTLNNLATQIYGGSYAQERGLQQQALGQLGQQYLGGQSQQLGALGTLGQQYLGQTGQQLGAAGQLGSQYLGLRGQELGALGSLGQQYLGQGNLQLGALGQMGTDFGRERALQLSSLGLAPQLANADYADINQLGQLGTSQDAYNQSLINADIARWDYGQNLTAQKLQQLNALLQGGSAYAGLNSTSTAPDTSNPLMGAIGGGMAGYQLGGAVGGMMGGAEAGASFGPWGALAGAVLGGLFS